MLEAKTIMNSDVVTVKKDASLYETINILIENSISGLPVLDDNDNLVGIISEKDILHLLVDQNVTDDCKVSDYMSKNVISFGPEESILTISEFFIKNPFRRVPIIDDGKVIGVIARRDVIELILKLRGKRKDK